MIRFLLVVVLTNVQAKAFHRDSVEQIHALMSTLHEQGEFNGSILVASNDEIVYSNGFGIANFKTGEKFTTHTASCVASVTKQFTAVCIMMLAEQNRLHYDDPVTKFVSLPRCYNAVTIRHLLTHTSGVFEYSDLGAGRPDKLIAKTNVLRYAPGERYEYSNSNYVLLSLVIEKVTRTSFPNFLKEKILDPLEMTRTSPFGSKNMSDVAVGYNQFGKVDDPNATATFGDGGLYSSAEDLLKWAQALYTDKLVGPASLVEAFRPASVRQGTTTYGFGWNIGQNTSGKFVWHTGNTAGFRAYIQRRLDQRRVIIILTNTGPSKRIEIVEAINSILDDMPYVRPRRSGPKKMYSLITKNGIREAISFYDSARAQGDTNFDFSESDLNLLGYFLLYDDKKVDDAIKIFELNTKAFPTSSNTFDSLGEAYLQKGDSELAKLNYRRALELDPTNVHAKKMLDKIK
jgi:CubicO group peptidase (beta-lactamase class C family)